jgi:HlyD family secretion protein
MRSYATAAPAPVPAPERHTYGPEIVRPGSKPPRRQHWLWLVGGIAVLAAVLAYRHSAAPDSAKTPVANVRTAVVRRGPLAKTLRLSGTTVAQKAVTLLTPQLRGVRDRGSHEFLQVLQKLVPSGSTVRKGETVAEFDRLYMLNRMDDYRAFVDQNRANLRKLNALLDVRRKAYEQQIRRAKADMEKAALDLRRAPVLSAITIEKTKLSLEEAKARYQEISAEATFFETSELSAIRASELNLQRCMVEFDRAQRNLDRMVVAAPLDGLAVMQTIRRGSDTAEVREGDQLSPGQPYMQIVDLTSMSVEANLNQVDAERVRIGQQARVQFDAYPGLELPARVVAVTAFARSRGWRGNYVTEVPIRLKFEQLDKRVIPNFSVSVDLILEQAEDAVITPRESVFQKGDKTFAYVRNPSGWEKRELQLGLSTPVASAVDSGLSEGEIVAAELPPTQATLP